LSAFQDNDKDKNYFFGRETFVDGLDRVVHQQPLVTVIGSSGSGKSSVVLAGLIPKLREEGTWLIESFRPNKQPFYELAAALISQLEPELGKTDKTIKAKELAKSIRQHGFTADVSAILKDKPGKRLLLVVDQFEELYTGCADTEQQQFVEALLAAVESGSRAVTLVLTLRADFYSYVVNYPPFGEALNKYPAQNLSLMKAEEMQSAIELPAEKLGVKLEEGLTQLILKDVKQEPGNLPLLEFALTQLWEKQSRGQLTYQAYSEIGGVAKALSNHAEAVYGKLSQEEQKQAQRIFLQLVRPGEGTEDTRRVATRREVGNWELVTFLAGEEARLVVTGHNEVTGEETVEVVHEALIWEWELLVGWLNKYRDVLLRKHEIEYSAKKWRDRGKTGGYLQGKMLKDARYFQRHQSGILTLSNVATEFIQESFKYTKRQIYISFIAPAMIVGLVGFFVYKNIEIRQLWATVESAQMQKNSLARKQALEKLVQAGESLENRDFVEYDLTGINLKNADLSGVNFKGAILKNADLRNANLSGSFLGEADLSGIKLNSAYLVDTTFTDAYLGAAKLNNADLSNADLSNADLSNSDLSGADLSNAKLPYTNLRRANLKGTNFKEAILSDSDIGSANLEDSNLVNADLTNTYLGDAKIGGANIANTNLSRAKDLTQEQLESAMNWHQARYTALIPNIKNRQWQAIDVLADKGWTKTSICLKKGSTLNIIAKGKWANGFYDRSDGTSYRPFYGADGLDTVDKQEIRDNWISPTIKIGTLIGKFNNKKPFKVGSKYNQLAEQDGCFYLSINDTSVLTDNLGALSVIINISR
jgi:uncharacterized protein YjbI with pentapeptide repeats